MFKIPYTSTIVYKVRLDGSSMPNRFIIFLPRLAPGKTEMAVMCIIGTGKYVRSRSKHPTRPLIMMILCVPSNKEPQPAAVVAHYY